MTKQLKDQRGMFIRVWHRLLQIRVISLGWLVLSALVVTLHLLFLDAGLVAVKWLLLGLLGLAIPFQFVALVLAMAVKGPQPIQNGDFFMLVLQRFWQHGGVLIGFEGLWGLISLPLGLLGLSSSFLARLPLPSLWINWIGLYRHVWWPWAVGLYVVLVGIWVLFLEVPVRAILGQSPSAGIWQRGRHNAWALITSVMLIGVPLAVVSEGLVWVNWVVTQQWAPSGISLLTFVTMLLIEAGLALGLSMIWTAVLWQLVGRPAVQQLPNALDYTSIAWFPLGVVVVLMGLLGWQTVYGSHGFHATTIISHRGVNGRQGVQNSVGALVQMSRQRVNFVETDVHETKDQQFVVFHDDQLRPLTHHSLRPRQLTLSQLVRLRVHENGQSAPVASLDAYLTAAEQHHQRLIVEIKTTPQDSSQMLQRFARRYGQRLLADGSMVHSLDYRVVTGLHRLVPGLKVGYITPFNFANPRSVPADFYSFQAVSMSHQFVIAAHAVGAPAFVWTPNAAGSMTRMWALGADGQITNQPALLRQVVSQSPDRAGWATLQNFLQSWL